jgi:hypothetical protein
VPQRERFGIHLIRTRGTAVHSEERPAEVPRSFRAVEGFVAPSRRTPYKDGVAKLATIAKLATDVPFGVR